MGEIIKLIIKITMLPIVLVGLGLLGAVINSLPVWSWLTYFFIIVRNTANMFSFMIDVNAALTVLGFLLIIAIARASFTATIWVIHYFRHD